MLQTLNPRNQDISYKSMNMLENRLGQLKSDIWVPDWGIPYNSADTHYKNVFLMGSYFEKIFQLEYWPDGDFRLFAMCAKVRTVLTELLGLEDKYVGLLDRYQLFSKKDKERSIDLSQIKQFYFAGRLSPQKNLEFLIFYLFHWQMLKEEEATLTLIGDFDSHYHKDRRGCYFLPYEEKIKKLIAMLPWRGRAPIFIQSKNETEWISAIPTEGVFISASNLISEDFSVTLAQIQANGFPAIIPDWGGFSDVVGNNIYFFEENLIADSNQNISAISKKAMALVKREKFLYQKKSCVQTRELPELLNKKHLRELIDLNKRKFGEDINFLVANRLPDFVKTQTGEKYFNQIAKLMKESSSQISIG